MEDYNDDDDRTRKVHQFYFFKFNLNEEAMLLRQREIDDQIHETQSHLYDIVRRRRSLNDCRLRSIQSSTEYRLSRYDQRKSSAENELRSLRGTLKLMSLKSPYRTLLHHGTYNMVGEREMIKKIKQELEEERIAEKERIAAKKEKVYHYWGYKPEPEPEPSYSLMELLEQIKSKEMAIDQMNTESGALKKTMFDLEDLENDLENLEKDLESSEKKMIQLQEQKAELDAVFFQLQRHNEDMKYARKLVERKNVEGVKGLSRASVDRFMSEWNNDSEFRKYYVERNLASLERRQFTTDRLSKMSEIFL